MTRKIKIYTTNGMPGTIETNVSTLGELKPILRQREVNYDGMKLLVGETKNELSQDEAILPEGDFKLYLMPAKTKSGVDFDEMEDSINRIAADVERIEDKLDKILSKLDNEFHTVTSVSVTSPISPEDQREIEEVRRLASGGSPSNEWDD
jgi:hypothetical protein